MHRTSTARLAVITSLLLAAPAIAHAATLEEPRAGRNASAIKKVEKGPDVRAPKKTEAPANPGSTYDSAAKKGAAESKRQHDDARKIIDNLK